MTELAGYFDGAYVRFLEGADIKKNQRLKILVMDDFVDAHNSHINHTSAVQSASSPFSEQEWESFIHEGSGVDNKKAAAFAALEQLREQSRTFFGDDFDYRKELAEAIDVKFGAVD